MSNPDREGDPERSGKEMRIPGRARAEEVPLGLLCGDVAHLIPRSPETTWMSCGGGAVSL